MPEVKANPDYQLVMNFLKLIQPGDMDEQSANQLMMIGQRIQNGGSLSDKEREMFQSVVGAMPMEGAMPAPMPAPATANTGMTDAQKRMAEEEAYFKRLREEQEQMYNMSQQAMQEKMQSAAPMTSPRPMARPMRQEAIMAEVNVQNMEENAELFMAKMGFPHDADGLNMTDEQLVNFVLLCQQEYMLGGEDEYEEDCDCDHGDDDCDCHHDEMMMPDDGIKVKVMRVGDGGSVHEMMNEILGGY